MNTELLKSMLGCLIEETEKLREMERQVAEQKQIVYKVHTLVAPEFPEVDKRHFYRGYTFMVPDEYWDLKGEFINMEKVDVIPSGPAVDGEEIEYSEALKHEYKSLSALMDFFPEGSRHKAAIHIHKRMEKILEILGQSKNNNPQN